MRKGKRNELDMHNEMNKELLPIIESLIKRLFDSFDHPVTRIR